MMLKPSPVSTRKFTWMPEEMKFVADISDLGPNFQLGQVYDDACDEGITLVSQWTGKEIVFALEREIRDGEGDLVGWELKSIGLPMVTFTAVIFND